MVDWDPSRNFFSASDTENSWHAVWGSTTSSSKHSREETIPQKTIGKGISVSSSYDLTIKKNDQTTITFIIAGSVKNKIDAIKTYEHLSKNYNTLLDQKKKNYGACVG
jgi:hypothetical protein